MEPLGDTLEIQAADVQRAAAAVVQSLLNPAGQFEATEATSNDAQSQELAPIPDQSQQFCQQPQMPLQMQPPPQLGGMMQPPPPQALQQHGGNNGNSAAGANQLQSSPEVEEFITKNKIDAIAAGLLREQEPRVQREVMKRGSLEDCRSPSAVCLSRIRDARNGWGIAKEIVASMKAKESQATQQQPQAGAAMPAGNMAGGMMMMNPMMGGMGMMPNMPNMPGGGMMVSPMAMMNPVAGVMMMNMQAIGGGAGGPMPGATGPCPGGGGNMPMSFPGTCPSPCPPGPCPALPGLPPDNMPMRPHGPARGPGGGGMPPPGYGKGRFPRPGSAPY